MKSRLNRSAATFACIVATLAVSAILVTPARAMNHHKNGQGADPSANTMMGPGARAMMGPGLTMPDMNAGRGRKLFASKGCVVCHSINGVGGQDARALDAATMEMPMNPFEFAARMWRGAEPMITLQRNELGAQIEFTGQELADIIAFIHHAEEQKKFSASDIPHQIKDAMSKAHSPREKH